MVTKKGTGKKTSKYVSTMEPFAFAAPLIPGIPSQYVKCRIHNLGALTHLNFEWPAVPTELTISVIKDAITKRHGGACGELILYKDQAIPECMLKNVDDGTTLKGLGIKGIFSGHTDELPVVTILYDFLTARPDDPILGAEIDMHQSAHGVDLKKYLRASKGP